jgi:O-antigen/teichoic acid export membrane protein
MPLSIISIARNSLKFTSAKAIAALAGFGVTLYAGAVLLPEEYGTYGLLSLWLTYVTLAAPGIYFAASREVPVLLGKRQEEDALRVQNIAISTELIYTIIPAAFIVAVAFFYQDTVMSRGLLIIAASYVAMRTSAMWASMNLVRERFNKVAVGNFITAIVSPAVVFASLHWLKVYALVLGPMAAYIALMIYYLTRGNIGFRFTFDKSEIIRLVKIGIVLQGLTIVLAAFRIVDRTVIASTLTREQLGLYVFAIGFLTYALSFFEDFARVLQPVLWRHAGAAGSIVDGFKDTRRIAVYLALGTAILIPLAQLIFILVTTLITKKYTGSVPIFNVLSYNLYLMATAIIPTLILNSSLVNKQKLTLLFYAIGLAVSAGLDVLVVKLGYGVVSIAWVTIGTRGLVTLILYGIVKKYIFETATDFRKFAIMIVIPLAASLPFYFLHVYLNDVITSLWALAGISLAAQAVAWSIVIVVFYRSYVSAREIRLVIQEIRAAIPGTHRDESNLMT